MSNEYELKLKKKIKSDKLRNSLEAVKEAVDTIWANDVRIIRDYTDHGCAHSQRIFQKLYEVIYFNKQSNITEEELYLLILGVYLHDIGMQCDIKRHENIKKLAIDKYHAIFNVEFISGTANSYSSDEQNEIRKNHHLLTAAWLDYAYDHTEDILSNALSKINAIYIEDLINICMFHSKLNIMDCMEKTDLNKVRRRFVATLLRFGDELDIDQYRVDSNTVKEFGFEIDNSIYWYLHERTQIKIDKNEVLLTVTLNPYDYNLCYDAIEKMVIENFKQKNKILTDVLTKNGLAIFISENSNVLSYTHMQKLPTEELNLIIDLGKKKIEEENETNSRLISKINELVAKDEDLLSIIAGEVLQNEFAKNHIKNVKTEAGNLFQIVQNLKYKYLVSEKDLKNVKIAFERIHFDKEDLNKYSTEIATAFQAFLFIQAFNTKQLTFFFDLGQQLHIQVYEGQAQGYARNFFSFYFNKFLKSTDANLPVLLKYTNFDYYDFEQIGRILNDYEVIVNFDYTKVKFSQGYLYKRENYGELLAISVSGESKKIFVWDISSGLYEPIAALGGLYEPVEEVKVIRIDSHVMVTAKGARQIYLWNLNSGSEIPSFIFRSLASIDHYTVIRSINEELYIIGTSGNDMYIWRMNGNEQPIKVYKDIKQFEDILVVDSKLKKDYPSYTLIGDEAYDSIRNSYVLELIEVSPLNFEVSKLTDKKSIIEDYCGGGYFENYSVNSYKIINSSKILGALAKDALVLYDLYNKKNVFAIPITGQRALNFRLFESDNEIYVLVNHIYQKDLDNGLGLVRCYLIQDDKLIDEKEWFPGKADISNAVLAKHENGFYIFFNQFANNIIYRVDYKSDEYKEFYKLPKSMWVIDMANG